MMGDPYRDTHRRTQGRDKKQTKNATQFSEGRQADTRPDLLLAKQSAVESARQIAAQSRDQWEPLFFSICLINQRGRKQLDTGEN